MDAVFEVPCAKKGCKGKVAFEAHQEEVGHAAYILEYTGIRSGNCSICKTEHRLIVSTSRSLSGFNFEVRVL